MNLLWSHKNEDENKQAVLPCQEIIVNKLFVPSSTEMASCLFFFLSFFLLIHLLTQTKAQPNEQWELFYLSGSTSPKLFSPVCSYPFLIGDFKMAMNELYQSLLMTQLNFIHFYDSQRWHVE